MKKLLLFSLPFLLSGMFSLSINAQKYAVFGATENSTVNGIYTENGMYNSHPVYQNSSYKIGYFGGGIKWAIVNASQSWDGVGEFSDTDFIKYGSSVDSSTLPITGWHHRAWSSGKPKDKVIVAALNGIGYHTDVFIESVGDDGSFSDTIQLYFFSETDHFTGADNDDFVSDGKVVVSNLPAGLTAEVRRISDSTALAIVTGTAVTHSVADNIDNLTLSFQNTAFANNNASAIEGATRNDFNIMFMQKYIVSNATVQSSANGEYILKGKYNGMPYFLNNDIILHYKGCSPKWTIVNMNGTHPLYSSTLLVENPENFDWRVGGFYQVGESITIGAPNSIVYNSQAFFESVRDNGQFPDTLIIQLYYPEAGNEFTGSDGEDYTGNGKITIQNVPAGLTPHVTKTSDTELTFMLAGTAASHTSADNISNLSFELTDAAFSSGDASLVANSSIDTLKIIHSQKYSVRNASSAAFNGIYSLRTIMNNHGGYFNSIGNTEMLFRGTGNTNWVLRNKTSTGNANYGNDASPELPPATGWHIGDYDGNTPIPIEVTLLQGNWFECTRAKLYETVTNDGAIGDTAEIWLLSQTVTLTGSNQEDFIASDKIDVTNVPEGLVAKAIRVDDRTLKFYLTGHAVNHNNTDAADSLIIHVKSTAHTSALPEEIQFLYNKIKIMFTANPDQIVEFDEGSLRFYPNPAQSVLNIEAGDELKDLTISVLSVSGDVLTTKLMNTGYVTFDISQFPSGLYLLKAENKEDSKLGKFVIKH